MGSAFALLLLVWVPIQSVCRCVSARVSHQYQKIVSTLWVPPCRWRVQVFLSLFSSQSVSMPFRVQYIPCYRLYPNRPLLRMCVCTSLLCIRFVYIFKLDAIVCRIYTQIRTAHSNSCDSSSMCIHPIRLYRKTTHTLTYIRFKWEQQQKLFKLNIHDWTRYESLHTAVEFVGGVGALRFAVHIRNIDCIGLNWILLPHNLFTLIGARISSDLILSKIQSNFNTKQ